MSYCFLETDDSVRDGVRRIAQHQIDKAISEVDDGDLGTHETVHQVRKRCKKLRGLIRAVRPVFPNYQRENEAFRDAAGKLSYLRDSAALIEAYDALTGHYGDEIELADFAAIRRKLTWRQKRTERAGGADGKLAEFRERMIEAKTRLREWEIEEEGFPALAGGIAKTYKRCRKAMQTAHRKPMPDTFHEWRKRTKYHWYHARLLCSAWKGPMDAEAKAADVLSDHLGDHHDLAVFRSTLRDERESFGKSADLHAFLALIDRRMAELEAEAFLVGERLLVERPEALLGRWRTYWEMWVRETENEHSALAA